MSATTTMQPRKKWKVWTGTNFEETTAVTEAQAINNIAWRMRQRGIFVIRWRMSAEEVAK